MKVFGIAVPRGLGIARFIGLGLLGIVLLIHGLIGDSQNVPWRHDWWDILHQTAPRDRGDPAAAPAVIVAIDELTRLQNGPWPWPRDQLANLVQRIADLGGSVLASDVILVDPDPQSPDSVGALLAKRATELKAFAEDVRATGDTVNADAIEAVGQPYATAGAAMLALGSSDEVLRDTLRGQPGNPQLRGIPTVLPVPGIPPLTEEIAGEGCDFPAPPIAGTGDEHALTGGFLAAEPPLPLLTENRKGQAELALAAIDFTAADDFVVRRVKALQSICEKRVLLLGAEGLRVASGQPISTVRPTWSGLEVVLGIPEDPTALRFPVERDGGFWLHFGPLGEREDVEKRYISAQRLFSPEFDPALIRGKVVLLAVIDLGRIDERRSPLGDIIWGIEAHVQMIEQIASGDFMRRPWFLFWLEIALTAALGLAILVLVPRAAPVKSLVVLLVGLPLLMALSLFAFTNGLLVDVSSSALGAIVIAGGVIGATLIERDRARFYSEIALISERADRSFLQGELDAAARIQTALLPPQSLQRAGEVDLAAYMDPARTVGGDFYDHAMIDDRHLFFLVADVSGKGADASQFMLLSKTLWKSAALRSGPDLATILAEANAEITRENTATMFVTGLSGVLDLVSGRLVYAAAGHDAPYLFSDHTAPRQVDRQASPPLGLVLDLSFRAGELVLKPGDRLCVFTDGVTEAMDPDGGLFGLEGLEAALRAAPKEAHSAAVVEHVVSTVRAFTAGGVQSDDLTLMVISRPD